MFHPLDFWSNSSAVSALQIYCLSLLSVAFRQRSAAVSVCLLSETHTALPVSEERDRSAWHPAGVTKPEHTLYYWWTRWLLVPALHFLVQTKSCLYRPPSFLLFAWLTVLKSNLEDNQAAREGGARGFKGGKITLLRIGKSRDGQVHVKWQASGVTTARTSQVLNQANAPRTLTPRQQKYLPWSRQVTVGLDIRTVAGRGLASISTIQIHTYVWKRKGDSTMTRLNIPSVGHTGIQAPVQPR